MMDAKTLIALRGSIAKWEGIVQGTVKDEGPDNCPLCLLFYNDDCEGCPVSEATGETCCDDSPYPIYWGIANGQRDGDPVAAAQAELDFLKSLLPPEEA